jgi:hypothetical protein
MPLRVVKQLTVDYRELFLDSAWPEKEQWAADNDRQNPKRPRLDNVNELANLRLVCPCTTNQYNVAMHPGSGSSVLRVFIHES